MTVIVYRSGTMSSDSLISRDGERSGSINKIRKTEAGLAGAAGDVLAVAAFLDWFEDGEVAGSFPDIGDADFTGLVVRPDGTMLEFDRKMLPYAFELEFAAIGSGAPYALGAMSAGADAKAAAKIACIHSTSCGGRIRSLRL